MIQKLAQPKFTNYGKIPRKRKNNFISIRAKRSLRLRFINHWIVSNQKISQVYQKDYVF